MVVDSKSSNELSEDVIQATNLPEIRVTGYCAMFAHGMHIRIQTMEEEKITCDSTIACVMWKQSQSTEANAGGTLDKIEYVGWVEEILELNYYIHYFIVLLCS